MPDGITGIFCTFFWLCALYPEINESHDYLALISDAKTIYFITRMNKTQFRNVTPILLLPHSASVSVNTSRITIK